MASMHSDTRSSRSSRITSAATRIVCSRMMREKPFISLSGDTLFLLIGDSWGVCRDERLFEHVAFAVRAAGRHFHEVIGDGRIAASYVIQEEIESVFRVFGVTVFAECDEVLRLPQHAARDEHEGLSFGIEEAERHGHARWR